MFKVSLFSYWLIPIVFSSGAQAIERNRTLPELINLAYKNNALLRAKHTEFEAEDSLVASQSTLDDPMVGLANLDRGNETTYGVISQKIRFPVKYYLQAKAQKSKAQSYRTEYIGQRFEVRRQVITLYYSIFSQQKVVQLTEANMRAVREFSRVAERKYAAGSAPQGDSMKAHFELTGLELDLIRFKQQEEALQSQLRAVLSDPTFKGIRFDAQELAVPVPQLDSLNVSLTKLNGVLKEKSPKIQSELFKLEETEWKSSLSKWEFAPDIQLQYQKRLAGEPADSEIYSVAVSFPLWFWKKGSEASAASSRRISQEYRVRSQLDSQIAKVIDLKGKVETGKKTLEIYRTSLIPQAQGAYNSSKASYRASKTTFLDLLDSERSLFKVRTGYYRSLQLYVNQLAELESELGFGVSDFDDLKLQRGKK